MSKEERIRKLTLLLKELFQFENNDLDFGIYRIINIKRKEISEFIDTELFDIIKDKIKTVEDNTDLEKNLESLKKEIENTFGCDIIEAKKKYAETPKVKDYVNMEKEFKVSEKESDIEEEIYDDIISFFSRYYDKGDFISKRRYSKDNKYAIPYNGEEVYLYWANNDQYYIKTAENFRNYSFKAGGLKVDFEITSEEVDVEKNNIKDAEKKFFIFYDADYDQNNKIVNVKFGYRGLSEDEEKTIMDLTDKKRLGKDEVNVYNLEKINEKIAIYGLSELQQKHTKMDGSKSDSSELRWHLNKYTTKNTSDYFIHKDLKKFLKQELDFYIKNELLHVDDIDTKENLNINLKRIKVFKEISLKIIEFLAQIEDFQKKLWEKKKFVIETDYCITLDYIDEKYYPEILANHKQLDEWKNLFYFDVDSEVNKLKGTLRGHGQSDEKKRIEVLKQNPTLTVDTKFYDNHFKYKLLNVINDIEKSINGILINSENFQALNLISNKYESKIKLCYIDPPYNTEKDQINGKFLYKDGFSRSSWLSLIENRLKVSYPFISNEGSQWVSIDDYEIETLKKLMDNLFGRDNFLNRTMIWYIPNGPNKGFFSRSHEYILPYAKDITNIPKFIRPKDKGEYSEERLTNAPGKKNPTSDLTFKEGLRYEGKDAEFDGIIGDKEPIEIIGKLTFKDGRLDNDVVLRSSWRNKDQVESYMRGEKTFDEKGQELVEIFFKSNGKPQYKKKLSFFSPKSVQNFKIQEHNLDINFPNPKQISLMKFILSMATSSNDLILDYFAGSGTTGHAVLNLNKEDEGNRKFILVEMGQYFDTVLKPRILKVIYSDNWKSGKPQDNNGFSKQIIKYQTIEQYDDSINNIDFIEPSKIVKQSKDYKIKYMLEFESKGSNTLLNIDVLDNPFEYKIKIEENNEMKEKNIDLVETFNYIYGIDVKTIQKKQNQDTEYVIVKGTRNEKDVVVIWRDKSIDFSPEEDKKFIETNILTEDFDEVFTNGNSLVTDAKSVDEIFKTHMFR